jgi:hypothetical protein
VNLGARGFEGDLVKEVFSPKTLEIILTNSP